MRTPFDSIQQATDLLVGRPDAGQIGSYRILPVTPLDEPIVRRRSRGDGQLIDNLWQVIPVASFHGGKRDICFRNLLEDSGWGVERDVGPVEADCEEEGLIVTGGNLFDGPARVGAVLKELFFVSLRPEVPEPLQVLDEPGVPIEALPRAWAYDVEVSRREAGPMVDFASCEGEVSVGGKVARHRHVTLKGWNCPGAGSVHVDPRSRGPQSIHDTGPGGVADGGLTVSVSEKHSSPGEAVNVGRSSVWMSSQTANPVIEVIDGDE